MFRQGIVRRQEAEFRMMEQELGIKNNWHNNMLPVGGWEKAPSLRRQKQ